MRMQKGSKGNRDGETERARRERAKQEETEEEESKQDTVTKIGMPHGSKKKKENKLKIKAGREGNKERGNWWQGGRKRRKRVRKSRTWNRNKRSKEEK